MQKWSHETNDSVPLCCLGSFFHSKGNIFKQLFWFQVDIIRDESKGGQCKGFGFVTMRDYGEAEHAVTALNGYNIGEYQYGQKRFLQVRFKVSKLKNQTHFCHFC